VEDLGLSMELAAPAEPVPMDRDAEVLDYDAEVLDGDVDADADAPPVPPIVAPPAHVLVPDEPEREMDAERASMESLEMEDASPGEKAKSSLRKSGKKKVSRRASADDMPQSSDAPLSSDAAPTASTVAKAKAKRRSSDNRDDAGGGASAPSPRKSKKSVRRSDPEKTELARAAAAAEAAAASADWLHEPPRRGSLRRNSGTAV